MAKKTNASWRDDIEKATSTDRPYLWTAEANAWHPITIWPDTLESEEADAIHQYGWRSIEMDHPESDGAVRDEIPFWCKSDLFGILIDADDGNLVNDDGSVDVQYRRRVAKNGSNSGEWRLP